MKNTSDREATVTSRIMMIRPGHFGFNEETALNNAFQVNDLRLSPSEIAVAAVHEFDRFVNVLLKAGLDIMVIEDQVDPISSDSVFPNNWFSTHSDGTVITYPMFSKQRRRERREDIFDLLAENFEISNRIHLEVAENKNQFLEGTGSLILDRSNKIAYACRSIRTNEELLSQWANLMNYEVCVFSAKDESNRDIYHTNVMMALGPDFVIWGGDSIPDRIERKRAEERFEETGKKIIPISNPQISAFAGNMLAVRNVNGENMLIMSQTAFDSLTKQQVKSVESFSRIIKGDIPTIEKYGGGSVRCMMAEIYLPGKSQREK
jgi:hypothetical protein